MNISHKLHLSFSFSKCVLVWCIHKNIFTHLHSESTLWTLFSGWFLLKSSLHLFIIPSGLLYFCLYNASCASIFSVLTTRSIFLSNVTPCLSLVASCPCSFYLLKIPPRVSSLSTSRINPPLSTMFIFHYLYPLSLLQHMSIPTIYYHPFI